MSAVTSVENAVIVEWWDPVVGSWCDMGEVASIEHARERIAGLIAADSEPRNYRIVATRFELIEQVTA